MGCMCVLGVRVVVCVHHHLTTIPTYCVFAQCICTTYVSEYHGGP